MIDEIKDHEICLMKLVSDKGENPSPMILMLKSKCEDGTIVPTHYPDGEIHNDLTIIVRTFITLSLQGSMTKRMSSMALVTQLAVSMGSILSIPDNLGTAAVEQEMYEQLDVFLINF